MIKELPAIINSDREIANKIDEIVRFLNDRFPDEANLTCNRCHKVIKGIGMMMPTTEPEKQLCANCAQDYLNEIGGQMTPAEMDKKLDELEKDVRPVVGHSSYADKDYEAQHDAPMPCSCGREGRLCPIHIDAVPVTKSGLERVINQINDIIPHAFNTLPGLKCALSICQRILDEEGK